MDGWMHRSAQQSILPQLGGGMSSLMHLPLTVQTGRPPLQTALGALLSIASTKLPTECQSGKRLRLALPLERRGNVHTALQVPNWPNTMNNLNEECQTHKQLTQGPIFKLPLDRPHIGRFLRWALFKLQFQAFFCIMQLPPSQLAGRFQDLLFSSATGDFDRGLSLSSAGDLGRASTRPTGSGPCLPGGLLFSLRCVNNF